MRFILVRTADDRFYMPQWRATCAMGEKTIDVFFYTVDQAAAKQFIRGRYPSATFSDETLPDKFDGEVGTYSDAKCAGCWRSLADISKPIVEKVKP